MAADLKWLLTIDQEVEQNIQSPELLMANYEEISAVQPASRSAGNARLISLAFVAVVLCTLPALGVMSAGLNAGVGVIGASFLAVILLFTLRDRVVAKADRQAMGLVSHLLEEDDDACFIANVQGEVLLANTKALNRFAAHPGTQLDSSLRSVFANPASILLRLQSRALDQGQAHEEVITRGQAVAVRVSVLESNMLFWRVGLDIRRQLDDVSVPVLTLGRDDIVLNVNEAALELLGSVPTKLQDILSQDEFSDGSVARIQTRNGILHVAFSTLRQSGSVRDVALVPLTETFSDYAATPFADLPVPIMCLSPQGEILETNRLAAALLGETGDRKSNIMNLMQGLTRPIQDWLERSAEHDATPHSEFLRLNRKDKEIFVQVTLSRIVRQGQVCLIAVLNDATELKTLEAQFVQGQKMQAVGQLAGGVAHDFNNLLTAISGHCDLLLLRHDQNDPNYSDLIQINQNANRAASLVSQLLAFSRKQTLRPEVLDLRDTISDLIHLLNRLVGEKVRLTLSHDPVLKPVRADKRQLEQVLMNLVVNARDAMPDGGEIRIETEVLRLSEPFNRDRATVQPGEYVTVKVIDSGTGIPADKLQKVFEPFFTTKRTGEGTGLGLSTAYGIVKQTGGFIFVDSKIDRGTEFTVYLPVCTPSEPEEPAPLSEPSEQGARQGEGVVLLVEDEAPVRAFATRALRLKGFSVLEAGSAEEALRLLEDVNLSVDMFVTDVVMPGMDGPTWVREAMKTRPDVKVIFMSGYTEGAFGETGPEIANSAFLPKPFSLTELTEAVFRQLS